MKSEEYLLLMGNPFGSKAVRMLSSMEKKSVNYQFPKKIEEVTELIYKDPEKLDLMILMNNCDSLESDTYMYLSESDMKDFDIQLEQDLRTKK